MDPEQLPLFVETPPFTRRWAQLGLTDKNLSVLQSAIMDNPQQGNVISGTGGFRKMRFVPENSGRGKSGAFRVIYLPIPRLRSIVLGVVFAKSEAANIDSADKRDLIRLAGVYESLLDDFFSGGRS